MTMKSKCQKPTIALLVNCKYNGLMEEPLESIMKHPKTTYDIYMVIDGVERLLTTADLKEVPIKCKHHPSLYNLMEGIKIGVTFSNKQYKSVDFRYEEVK